MKTELLPEGWQMVKFAEIAKQISKRVEPAETELSIYVGLEHLDSDNLKISRYGSPSDVKGQKLLVRKGQIIFGKRRAYQRKVAIADFDCICSAHAMVLEANEEKVLPEFLPFFMLSDLFMNRAISVSEGSLSPTIKWKVLGNQSFVLPNKDIQETLLKEIKKANSVVDIAEVISGSLKKVIESHYWTFFSKDLNVQDVAKYPLKITTNEKAIIVRLKDLLAGKPQNGQFVRKGGEKEFTCKFLNVVDGYENSFSGIDNRQNITCDQKELDKYKLSKGDVLFNRSSLVRAGIGWPYLVTEDSPQSTFDCHLIRVVVDEKKVLPEYLYIYALSPWARKYFLCVGQTTTMTTISQSEIEEFPIPVVPIKEQEKVVQSFSELFALQGYFKKHQNSVLQLSKSYVNSCLER